VVLTFAEVKAIVRAAEQPYWTLGTYTIENNGWKDDATRYLVVRGAAEAMDDNPDPNYNIAPGLVPLVNKETGEIEYVVRNLEWDRIDAMRPCEIPKVRRLATDMRAPLAVHIPLGGRECCGSPAGQANTTDAKAAACTIRNLVTSVKHL
jgi:hypothetical protein